jgi:hypothetical protein
MNDEEIIGFDALYESMYKCKKGVGWKDSVAHYYLNGIEETLKLEQKLKDGTYIASKPAHFKITSPKPRDIISISFRDRVYQRSLNDNALYPIMSKRFIHDNAACQKGKGTDFARERLICFLQKFYRKHGKNGYILQCDIHGYYPNMRHETAETVFRDNLEDYIFERAKVVLNNQYSGEVGYNPGSQMIQIAGISVLDKLDHFIKERLHIKYYIRYMDDFILIHESKEYLEYCQKQIREKLTEIGFEFNEKKTKIRPIEKGLLFLGFKFILTDTGKVLMFLNPNNVKHERKKLRRLVCKAKKGFITKEKVDQCYQGWRNHASKGNSFTLLRRMDKYYKDLWRYDDVCKKAQERDC